jgi:hypothetical protein
VIIRLLMGVITVESYDIPLVGGFDFREFWNIFDDLLICCRLFLYRLVYIAPHACVMIRLMLKLSVLGNEEWLDQKTVHFKAF